MRHQGVRWTYAELDERGRPRRARAGRRRPGAGRPDGHLGAQLRRVGARPVRVGQGRRDPRQRQPRLPDVASSSTCSTSPAAGCWSRRAAFKTSDYVAMVEEVAARAAPRSSGRSFLDTRRLGRAARARGDDDARRAAARGPAVRRPDQHPVHERHDGLPEGRDALAPQHPQQRLLRRRGAAATRTRTASASPCPSTTASAWSWATSAARTHGACMVVPAPAFEPGATLAAVAGGALHVALRRADDVHRRARPSRTSTRYDLSVAAHRDHGRLAVPGRGHAQGHRPHAHGAT